MRIDANELRIINLIRLETRYDQEQNPDPLSIKDLTKNEIYTWNKRKYDADF